MALTKVTGEFIDIGDIDISDVGTISLDAIQGDADANTSITFSGSDVITIATGGSGRLTIGDGALSPVTNNQIDLGTSSLEFKNAFFDGTVTADAFAGPLTGDVTGNVSGTAATVTTAAQSAITSVGTLTGLTVSGSTTLGATSFGEADLTNVGTIYADQYLGDADANSGIVLPGSDVMTLHTAGSERMRILSDGKVGIGTASPSRQLTVSSSGQTDLAIVAGTSASAQLQFGDSGDDNIGQIEYNNSTNNMMFYANATEHMRINSNGNINIGIGGSGGDLLLQPLAKLYLDAGGDTYIVESSGNEIDIYTGGARRLRINQDGLIFNTDTATANALSDYEEGTWTPTYTVDGGGSAGTVTSTNVATYTKIGNLVHCRVRSFYVPTSGTVPTAYNISLPFQAKNNGGLAGYGVGREIAQNGKSLFIEVDGNGTTGKIKCKDGSAPPANAYIDIAFTYEAP